HFGWSAHYHSRFCNRRTPNMRFTKFQGFGNDYIVFEAAQLADVKDLGDFARRICNRHYGAGSDGIAIAQRSDEPDSDFRVRIFNPDGSEAGMSGNGTRCAASYLFFHELWSKDVVRLQTRNGIKRYHLLERSGGSFLFRSELGQPKFDNGSIPMELIGDGSVHSSKIIRGFLSARTSSSFASSIAGTLKSASGNAASVKLKAQAPAPVPPSSLRSSTATLIERSRCTRPVV